MIFLDTSFIIAYYNTRDQNHNRANNLMADLLNDGVIINDYVFDECANILLARLGDFKKTIEICTDLKNLKIINIDESLFEEAWNIFKNQSRTKLSFTDSTILSTMNNNKITELATFDEDFRKVPSIKVMN